MRTAVLLLALGLSGCGLCPPAREGPIPVPTPCFNVQDMPRATFATDAQLSAMSDYQLALALEVHRTRSLAHIAKLEALLLACQ